MITVTIHADDFIKGGQLGVARILRQGGIPVRIGSDAEIRLCQVWSADGERCLGYGELEWVETDFGLSRTFNYKPPIDRHSDVIDVEARVVIDTPLLKS